jgi:hypothetical protein
MLTSSGKLTDIGSWYLGGAATGNVPSGVGRVGVVWGGMLVSVALGAAWAIGF